MIGSSACRWPRLAWIVPILLGPCAGWLSAAPPASQPTAERIDAALARAKKWVYAQQHDVGHWEKDSFRKGTDHANFNMQGDTFGGYTALATYALLVSGESPNNPRIRAAVEFLKSADIVGIYAIAMRCQVWLLVPHQSPEMRALIHKDAETLFAGINDGRENPKNKGLWDYLGRGPRVDHSVSQYGVLGLWACQQADVGIEVGGARWKLFEDAWSHDQYPSGGWDYGPTGGETLSMTAAGIATMFIIADYLHAEEAVICKGNVIHPAIDRGLNWMDKNFDQVRDDAYAMYGIERIGAASGYRKFANHDWFSELSARLLDTQNPDGSWSIGSYPGAAALDNTCFAMVFLARGRAPLMANKLDYHVFSPGATQPIEANWDERPRDMANLAAWVGHATESFLQWQIVNLLGAPEDLHDAPLLYIAGNEELKLSQEEAKKIKTFIQEGGIVLGNADCGREAFSRSFQELGRELFGRPFRELPAGHPAFTHQQFPAARWHKKPRVLGLSNGVRELMLLIPDDDPSRYWQVPRRGQGPHEEAYELGDDLYQYSNDRKLWNRGDSYWVRLDPEIQAARKIKLARLEVGANWDPEPGGWWRVQNLLHNQDQLDITVFPVKLGAGALAAAQVAHLTGTSDFRLSEAARLELKTFVENGGTLVVDAAGGSFQFADAAERELKSLFGIDAIKGLSQPLPPSHPLFTLEGHKIETFTYRPWARLNSVGALKQPRIRGIEIGNRTAVFYSREDLSAGLVGQPVDGIIGYTPETATRIMRNILLYSAAATKPPATATAPAAQAR